MDLDVHRTVQLTSKSIPSQKTMGLTTKLITCLDAQNTLIDRPRLIQLFEFCLTTTEGKINKQTIAKRENSQTQR